MEDNQTVHESQARIVVEERPDMATPEEDNTPLNTSPSHIKDGRTHSIELKTDDLLIN